MGKKKPLGQRNEIVANVLTVFGGLECIAGICDVGRSAVCQWRDSVPYKHQRKLLEHAKKNGIKFDAADFFGVKAEAAGAAAPAISRKRVNVGNGVHLMS